MALDEALQVLRKHQGRTAEELLSDPEERWIVERGLQLCAQNVLDVALLDKALETVMGRTDPGGQGGPKAKSTLRPSSV